MSTTMKKTYCNPLDLEYRYQHMKTGQGLSHREGADPTLIYFKGSYYVFVSMSAGFWQSDDLINWNFVPKTDIPIYDYAPDVRQVGDYLYFCASERSTDSPIFRTKDPVTEKFEKISAPFPFWDPDIFCDDDGSVYFYWGCTNIDPIWGVEMNPVTMLPITEPKGLIYEQMDRVGYERPGENCVEPDLEDDFIHQTLKKAINPETGRIEKIPTELNFLTADLDYVNKTFQADGKPYLEGAFMTKYDGRYYLQYACPGTEFNTYSDGVYVSNEPLGNFTIQSSNPFSSKPGGFITGSGHGSTIFDKYGNLWHTSTMRISINHSYERRIGLFPAGIDEDGVMYCNQNFADYPIRVPEGRFDARTIKPEWMLLSYKKPIAVSSTEEGSNPDYAVDENIRTWWSATSNHPGEWLSVDLGSIYDVHAIQVNLADEKLKIDLDESAYGGEGGDRCIELEPQISNYKIEISEDGIAWQLVEDVSRECSNGYYEYLNGIRARYVRVIGGKLPYGQVLRISGLRVFGKGKGEPPAQTTAAAQKTGDMNALISWESVVDAQGYNVRYGIAPDKLYMSWMVYDDIRLDLGTLIKEQKYYICVDTFNENGITEGKIISLD